MKHDRRRTVCIFLCILCAQVGSAQEFDEQFANPPEETKPWCYWYWLDGDITQEGITKDLESMARVGIHSAMIGNVSFKNGPVKTLSPQWRMLTRHALREANRVGVDIYMFNSPGWSQSGGPWIKPEQSMRRVTWNEFPAEGGVFSQKVRPVAVPASQDIALLAVPRLEAVSLVGSATDVEVGDELSLTKSKWIWHPAENGASDAPASTRYFKHVIQADPAKLSSATIRLTADNTYALSVNGKDVLKDDTWETVESASIKKYLRPGTNTITIAVTNTEASPAGVIAAVRLRDKAGKAQTFATDKNWLVATSETEKWLAAREMGPMGMMPWRLKDANPEISGGVLRFTHTEPVTARALVVHGKAKGKLYALQNGEREFVAEIDAAGGNPKTDFLHGGVESFSFKGITAKQFELVPAAKCKVVLTSAPKVAQFIEKQMGRMHPTPSPTWESYIFPDSVEPDDPSTLITQRSIVDLSNKLGADGVLNCTLPEGDWTIIYFGMVSTGKTNHPAPREATGLEVDKMSRTHTRHHFDSYIGSLHRALTPEEKAAFKGITIDSYEVGSQNWTDGFAAEFEKRNGYNPVALLPVMTGRVVDSARISDQFLWDLRRTVADMIAEYYVGGLRDVAHEHGLALWCENYGHWGFPGDFTIYGGYADEIGGEFWSTGNLGPIECRAGSSAGHIYGKRRVYAEAFTSRLNLGDHPYAFKARGEQLFCEGINHFVLHVSAHQTRDGVPGKNPWFGTAFHRNTPWFNESRDWVKYLQRCHTMLQQGEPVADVAVYIGDFAPQMTGPANPVAAGYDYDYIGSDAILRKLQVVDGQWVVYDEHDPQRIAARYSLLAMPKVKYIRPHVLKRLEALKTHGGRIVDGVPVQKAALLDAGIMPIVFATSCPIRWKARRLDDGGMLFFLSNFGKTGVFEATLRVKGKMPELFNPVTGEVKRIARYQETEGGTKLSIHVNDKSDSCFLVFRDKPTAPSVVKASASVAEFDLYYDRDNRLVAETDKAGTYTLVMSDGSKHILTVEQDVRTLAIQGPWQTTNQDEKGFSVLKETTFNLPAEFGKGQRILLDLGRVEVMAKVTLNGKVYDTLWMPPFELDVTDALKAGQNTLSVLVTSTSQGKPTLGSEVQLRTVTRTTIDQR